MTLKVLECIQNVALINYFVTFRKKLKRCHFCVFQRLSVMEILIRRSIKVALFVAPFDPIHSDIWPISLRPMQVWHLVIPARNTTF